MAQHVGAQSFGTNSGRDGERLDLAGEMLAREVAALAERGEHPAVAIASPHLHAQSQIVGHGALGCIVERNKTFRVALAADHEHARIAARRGGRKRDELGYAQPRGVEQLDEADETQCPQALAAWTYRIRNARSRGGKQSLDLRNRKDLWKRSSPFGAVDCGRRIIVEVAFGIEETIKLSDCREPPPDRRRREAARCERCEIAAYVVAPRRRDHAPGRNQM